MLGEGLRAVEVAERDVVDAVEDRARHLLDAADRDGPLRIGRLAAGDERVREHDRPHAGAAGEVFADPAHGLGEHARVPARVRHAQRVPRRFRFQVRIP